MSYRDHLPHRKPVAPCVGWLAHNCKTCDCYDEVVAQAFEATLHPRFLSGLRCAFGYHRWADDQVHWRRWCLECECGREAAPSLKDVWLRERGVS